MVFPCVRQLLLALEDEKAAKILHRCDDRVAGGLLSLAAEQPAWTRKIIGMVTVARAGRLLDNLSQEASAAALALPPTEPAAHAMSRAKDATIKAILGEMSEKYPSRAAPLVLALDDLDPARMAQILGTLTPASVARILHWVSSPSLRESLLSRLPWQFRPLVGKHLKSLEGNG